MKQDRVKAVHYIGEYNAYVEFEDGVFDESDIICVNEEECPAFFVENVIFRAGITIHVIKILGLVDMPCIKCKDRKYLSRGMTYTLSSKRGKFKVKEHIYAEVYR